VGYWRLAGPTGYRHACLARCGFGDAVRGRELWSWPHQFASFLAEPLGRSRPHWVSPGPAGRLRENEYIIARNARPSMPLFPFLLSQPSNFSPALLAGSVCTRLYTSFHLHFSCLQFNIYYTTIFYHISVILILYQSLKHETHCCRRCGGRGLCAADHGHWHPPSSGRLP
jgi:hypothetical protein